MRQGRAAERARRNPVMPRPGTIRYHRPVETALIASALRAPAAALPRITVATVVPDGDRFLFVEERVRGRLVVNQPAGHLEPGESLIDAAVRETLEETGWRVEPSHLVAVYHWPDPPDRKPVLRFTFAARPLAHEPDRPLDAGIVRALWLRPDELAAGHALRSPLVRRSLDDHLAGQRGPLSLLACVGG